MEILETDSRWESVLTAAGGGDILDAQELLADDFQFLDIFDFEPDGEHTSSAGQVLAHQFLDTDPGGGHGLGNVQQQTVAGDAFQLQSGLKGLLLLDGPADTDPAGSLFGIVPVLGIGTP